MTGGEYLVVLDEKSRLQVPAELRRKLGLGPRSRVVLRLRADGVVEMIPFERLWREAVEAAERLLGGWREEDHEASRLLSRLVAGGASRK